MNRRLARLAIAACLALSCAPTVAVVEAAPRGTPAGASRPDSEGRKPKKPTFEPLPADAVLWEGAMPDGVDSTDLLEKDGVLTKNTEPTEDVSRWWPYAIDYWGLARTDLDTLLAPHVGRAVRVRGHYKKIYDHGTWVYEVEPVSITALADAAAPR